MRKCMLSIAAIMSVGTFAMAGGDIQPVEPVVETPVVVEEPASPGNFYIGAGVSILSWNMKGTEADPGIMWPTDADNEATWTGGTVLAGYQINPYVAIEGRYTLSMTDASWKDHGVDAGDDGTDLSNIAIYLKPMLPVGDTGLAIYGLLGYGQTTIEFEGPIGKNSENGFQWGAGASYAFTDGVSVFVDYTKFYDGDGFDTVPSYLKVDSDSITFGVMVSF